MTVASKASVLAAGRRLRRSPVAAEIAAMGRRAATALYRVPAPEPLRKAGARLRRRPGLRTVPIDRFLLGDEGGLPAADYAAATGDLTRPSTTIDRWPHVRLIEAYRRVGDDLLRAETLGETDYVRNAMRCVEVTGRYFSATDEAGVLDVARGLLHWAGGGPAPQRGPLGTAPGAPVRVRRIRHSECLQVVDGHHRLAIAYANGETVADVAVDWKPVWTPMQKLLREMSWLEGRLELYQPLDLPELGPDWALVRRCDDRLSKMLAFLGERGLEPSASTSYLDVACCYGWFVAQMQRAGFEANGIERDPLGPVVSQHVFQLDPDCIAVGDAVELLRADARRYDVVSCFSLLHHFVLGRGSASAEELAGLLDATTAKVLFLDTGQEHEEWFRTTLAGWSAGHVERWLAANTTFREIVRLGPDEDAVGRYAGNYGRMLFACVR